MNTRNGVTFQLNWRVFFHSQFAITHAHARTFSLLFSFSVSLSLSSTHTHTQACELHNDMVSHQIHLKLWNPIHWGGGEDSWPFLSLSLSWSRGQLLLLLPQPTSFHSKTKTIQTKWSRSFFSQNKKTSENVLCCLLRPQWERSGLRETHTKIFFSTKYRFSPGFWKKHMLRKERLLDIWLEIFKFSKNMSGHFFPKSKTTAPVSLCLKHFSDLTLFLRKQKQNFSRRSDPEMPGKQQNSFLVSKVVLLFTRKWD